jgi:hypothetical protein
VSNFYEVVMADDEFDKRELVIILLNVLRAMKYLKDALLALSTAMAEVSLSWCLDS